MKLYTTPTRRYEVISTKDDDCIPAWTGNVMIVGFIAACVGVAIVGWSISSYWFQTNTLVGTGMCIAFFGCLISVSPFAFKTCGVRIDVIENDIGHVVDRPHTIDTYYFQFTDNSDNDAKNIKQLVNTAIAKVNELIAIDERAKKAFVQIETVNYNKATVCCEKYKTTMSKVTGSENK